MFFTCDSAIHGFEWLVHSKKGIVILTSGLLYEFQTSEARAKLVCVCVLREFIRNAENTLAMSKLMHR